MTIYLNKQKNITVLDALFVFWLISELMFAYTTLSRIALVLFVAGALLCVKKYSWSYALTAYALFAVWSVLNIITDHAISESTAKAMTETMFFNLALLFAFVCYCKYVGNYQKILTIYKWIITIFCIVCIVGGMSGVLAGERLSVFEINSNAIAMLAAYASILSIHDFLNKKGKLARWGDLALVLVYVLTIVLSGSRKGLIIPIVGLYVLVCMRKPQRFLLYSVGTILLAFFALLAILKIDILYNLIGYRVEPIIDYITLGAYNEASMESRMDYISLAWERSWHQPIWGHGLDCFRVLSGAHDTYSHCNFVEILFSLGCVGFLIYYIPYLWTLFKIPKALKRNKQLVSIAVAMLIPYLVCEYFQVTYFTRTSVIIPTLTMLIISMKGADNETQKTS